MARTSMAVVMVCLLSNGCGEAPPTVTIVPDAQLDAGPSSINGCSTAPGPTTCAPTSAPTLTAGTTRCDPLTQQGCAADEKCTTLGQDRIYCVPDGPVGVGCPCTLGNELGRNYDDCSRGTMCVNGRCTPICDPGGGAAVCAEGSHCVTNAYLFLVDGRPIAGACHAACDPLTQCVTTSPDPDACGSADPVQPDLGCYGHSEFSCAFAPPAGLTSTDRVAPVNPGLNGCAPGFVPFFYEQTGSTVTLCSGLCAALETDNTPAHAGNGRGDPTALAKLPMDRMPLIGNATCEPGKKGSEASSRCRFLWPFLSMEARSRPAFAPYLDTLGVCMAIDHFRYDEDGDSTAETPYPECSTLPPRSASTPGEHDDAADFNCQKLGNAMRFARTTDRTAPAFRVGNLDGPMRGRHALR